MVSNNNSNNSMRSRRPSVLSCSGEQAVGKEEEEPKEEERGSEDSDSSAYFSDEEGRRRREKRRSYRAALAEAREQQARVGGGEERADDLIQITAMTYDAQHIGLYTGDDRGYVKKYDLRVLLEMAAKMTDLKFSVGMDALVGKLAAEAIPSELLSPSLIFEASHHLCGLGVIPTAVGGPTVLVWDDTGDTVLWSGVSGVKQGMLNHAITSEAKELMDSTDSYEVELRGILTAYKHYGRRDSITRRTLAKWGENGSIDEREMSTTAEQASESWDFKLDLTKNKLMHQKALSSLSNAIEAGRSSGLKLTRKSIVGIAKANFELTGPILRPPPVLVDPAVARRQQIALLIERREKRGRRASLRTPVVTEGDDQTGEDALGRTDGLEAGDGSGQEKAVYAYNHHYSEHARRTPKRESRSDVFEFIASSKQKTQALKKLYDELNRALESTDDADFKRSPNRASIKHNGLSKIPLSSTVGITKKSVLSNSESAPALLAATMGGRGPRRLPPSPSSKSPSNLRGTGSRLTSHSIAASLVGDASRLLLNADCLLQA
jgi:hypothetical protein